MLPITLIHADSQSYINIGKVISSMFGVGSTECYNTKVLTTMTTKTFLNYCGKRSNLYAHAY